MLIRLTVEQVSAFWDIIKYAVEMAHPPHVLMAPEQTTNVLEDLLCGTADCWVSYQKGEKNMIDAVVVSKVIIDDTTKVRNLLLYTVFAYEQTNKDSWISGGLALAKWAKSKGCVNVIGFTSEPEMIEIVNKLGGDTRTVLGMVPVNILLGKEI